MLVVCHGVLPLLRFPFSLLQVVATGPDMVFQLPGGPVLLTLLSLPEEARRWTRSHGRL